MKKNDTKAGLLALCMFMALCAGSFLSLLFGRTGNGSAAYAASALNIPGAVTASRLNVRTKASTKSSQLTVNKEKVSIVGGTKVKILSQSKTGGETWYYISFSYLKKTQKGYVLSDYVKLTLNQKVKAAISNSKGAKIRKKADTSAAYITSKGKKVTLKKNTSVTITKEVTDKKGTKWYNISFTYQKKEKTGFIKASEVVLKGLVFDTGVTTSNLNVRTGAGTNFDKLTHKGKSVLLPKGTKLTILSKKTVDGTPWYQAQFTFGKAKLKGYVCGTYVKLDSSGDSNGSKDKPADGGSSGGSDGSKDKPSDGGSSGGSDDSKDKPSDDGSSGENFETYLKKQGFPESYRPALRILHEKYPKWVFKAYDTGLDWATVVENESKIGRNLISKNKSSGWQSYEAGAYNWATDSFIPYDGTTWVTASKQAVAYYMDPRNFLTASAIFQFEALEYQKDYQTKSGVERCLSNTPMAKAEFTYKDDESKKNVSMLYSEAFLDAARISGVSPYHLASRSKQEVVTGSTTFSSSVSGKVSGYEGIYNFYNIGASNSAGGGAVEKGLKYASQTNVKYFLPWNNRYKAIIGGGVYIGANYINRGQNTIYLQKFNVTPISTYNHQYMANVEAANSEATKTYNAYSGMLDEDIVFNIPVYNQMPDTPADLPAAVKNPNNWLKSLKVDGYKLSPVFSVTDAGKKTYSIVIEDPDVDSVKITGVTASQKAAAKMTVSQDGKVKNVSDSASGVVALTPGDNVVKIVVTAENGDKNSYKITITKNE